MPKITQTQNGGVIRWDANDWLNGLLPHYTSSLSSNLMIGDGLLTAQGTDVFRKPGYIMPGANPVSANNESEIGAIIKNGVVHGSKAYLIEAGAKMHELDLTDFDGTGITATGDFPHTISTSGTGETGSDIIAYNPSGTKYIFYSHNDSTDGDVGRYDLSSTFDDDYMSTTPTGAAALDKDFPHPMIVGDDNILYIGDGKDLASFDGTTFNSSALDLPEGYIITSFAKTSTHLVIYAYQSSLSGGVYYRSESTAFFWNYRSESFDYAYPLQGNYVNGGFNYKDTVGCFVQGRSSDIYSDFTLGKKSKMLLFTGTGFESVVDFSGDIPEHGGVNVESDVIYWLSLIASTPNIYQYGSPFIGFKKILQKILIGNGGTAGGMLKNFSGASLIASSGSGTSGGLEQFSSSGYDANCAWATPVVSPSFPQDLRGQIKNVKVYWGAAASGGHKFSLLFRTEKTGTITTVIDELTTVTDLITDYDLDSSGDPLPLFESIKLIGDYAGGASATAVPPFIEAVEVYFDYVNINN